MSYVCEKSVGPGRNCDFRSGKIILQQEVAREQMSKLLAEGRTDLLQGFVSSRTRRRFKAFLARGADGKIGFEFEPRPARAPKAGAVAAPAGKAGPAATKKTPAKGAPAQKPPAKKAPAKQAPAKKAPAKKAPARKPAAKTAPATTAAPKKAPARKAAIAKPVARAAARNSRATKT